MIEIKKICKYFFIISLVLITVFMLNYFNYRRISNVINRIEYLYLDGKDINDYVIKEANKIVKNKREKNSNDYFILGYYNLNFSGNKKLAKEYFEKTIENKNNKTSKFAILYSSNYLCEGYLKNKEFEKAIQCYKDSFESLRPTDYNKYQKILWSISKKFLNINSGLNEVLNVYNTINEYSYKLNNKNKLYLYERLTIVNTILNKYASAMEYNLKVIDYAVKTKNNQSRYKAAIELGVLAKRIGQYDEALKILNDINYIDVNNEEIKAELNIYKLINQSDIEASLGNYDKSLNYLNEINKYKNYINKDKYKHVKSLENIIRAICLSGKGDYQGAINILAESKQDIEENKISFFYDKDIMYYDALADIYFNKGEYDLAIESYEKLLDLSKERNDLEHIEKALTGLVRASSNTDEYENKDKYINELLYWERFINKNFSENYYNNSIRKYEFNRTRKENSLIKIVNIIFKFLIIILFLIVFKLKIYYVINKIRLRKKIKRYLDQNMYFLNYQPIVDPKKEKIVGFEALLRLKIEDQVVMPNLIINEIEKADMINEVSIWILNKIISDYGELTKIRGISGKFYVSMNISLKEIEDIDFIKKLANILKDSKLYNQKIAIEITENNKCKDDATVKNNIEYLRRSGFLVALDDFGVEYSNLSMLEKFNFDIIKLDKCFIENIENSDVNKSIIETSDYLSCTKNKTIVVEGVETINQVDFIKNTNSQKIYIQGYFYSKPLKIEDLKKIDLFNIV